MSTFADAVRRGTFADVVHATTPRGRAAGGRPPAVGATGAVGVLSRLRTELRLLEPVVEDLDPTETPERVLTLLEDALLSLADARADLKRRRAYATASHRLEHLPGRDL